MSKVGYSRTSRAQRGRGPYAGSYQSRPVNRSAAHDDLTQGQPGQSSGAHVYGGTTAASSDHRVAGQSTAEPRSLQSNGSYYSLPPDPKKNESLKKTAEVEERGYLRHKAEKREQTAQLLGQQPPAAVGGRRQSKEDLDKMRQEQERMQQMEARFVKVRQREKCEEYRRQKREKEEEELRKMKQAQREKAVRQKARDEQEHQRQLEETRRKRLERFDKGNN